jgi:hypothetical protein
MSFHCFSSNLMEKLTGGFTLPLFETSGGKLPILNFGVQIENLLKLQRGKLNFAQFVY